MSSLDYRTDEQFACRCDSEDALAPYRAQFHIPPGPDGTPCVYLAGNSLGLEPKGVLERVNQELFDWAHHGVEGHFEAETPWYSYHEAFRESGAKLVGAKPCEVVLMNSLSVNLHLMMVSFYRPTRKRYKILIEDPCFPSDIYAVKSQLAFHGYDPGESLVTLSPRKGEHTLHDADIAETLEREGGRISLVLLGGVNFVTGQLFDMRRITELAHARGCIVGFDLAHAAGNVPLMLHDWNVDFACWCNYKYLNGGPGAVAGCFVHERHGKDAQRLRFAGWWGNDPVTRFKMQLIPEFAPRAGADGWQISNPPILSLSPVKVSYDMFNDVGIDALRAKSLKLTGYLEFLVDELAISGIKIMTPRDPEARGCQLSLLIEKNARDVLSELKTRGVCCDFREPDVIRVAPVPLYNTFHDVWRFAESLRCAIAAAS